jgi:stage II sporulation protein D
MGNEPVILALYNGKIAVKLKNSESYICDSLLVRGLTGNDRFSFRINGGSQLRHLYSGDLKCLADLNTMVFINITDTEEYIAGVVRAEGGPGKNLDYLKSQAVLTRTFMYRHMHRHAIDRYNLCDNTHCQAFDGISDDSLIKRAVLETKDLVVLANDSTLIISAYHSNCGGETAEAEDVWLSGYPYLKKVNDPYCLNSRSAKWSKSIPLSEWESYLRKSGFIVPSPVLSYNFSQLTRMPDYKIGTFSLPFRKIRDDLYLRSSFFSVVKEGDSIVFKGRGYGHGVGLCQEGAKVMAEKGLGFSEIIKFYYTGVLITDVKNARIIKSEF